MTKERAAPIASIGKNIIVLGFAVWLVTNLTHTYFSTFFPALYQESTTRLVYTSIVPIILGLLVHRYWLKDRLSTELPDIVTTALLMVFLANSFQGIYSAIETYNTEPDGEKAEVIPFMSARPWLPSKTLATQASEFGKQLEIAREVHISEMDSLSGILSECGIMTDSVFLMIRPNARTVAHGGKYQAEVVLAAKLDSNHVKGMSVNGQELPFHNGMALYEEASNGSGTKYLDFQAEVLLFGGEPKTISNSESYRTVSSFIEVSSQAINSLYRNCGNRLSVQVPALGNDYHPRFVVDGGDFRTGRDRGFITILPTSNRVNLGVYNNGIKIGDRSFPVRNVPPPTIRLLVNGNEVDLEKGIIAQTPQIELQAVPNPDFQRIMPQDSRYRVTACEISLLGGAVVKGSLKDYGTAQIAHLMRRAQPGDYLKIEVQQVLRKNFKGDTEEVSSFSPHYFTVPIL